MEGAFPAAELVLGEEPEARVVGFVVVGNAEPDRVGGRLVFQAGPGYLDMLNEGAPDPSRVARVQDHADRLQFLSNTGTGSDLPRYSTGSPTRRSVTLTYDGVMEPPSCRRSAGD